MPLVWIALGLGGLTIAAEFLVRYSSRLAVMLRVPPIVIGLTIVAIGTSAPELAVNIDAAFTGNGELAVANIAGTNTVNLLLIMGTSALMAPLVLDRRTLRFDLPVMTGSALVLLFVARGGSLSRGEGVLLAALGIAYTLTVIYLARSESRAVQREFVEEYAEPPPPSLARGMMICLGVIAAALVVIVVSAGWLVDGAVDLARALGVSEVLIGLTIVAIGTSSPELVTTIVGTLRSSRDVAVGNLIGSSVYNILFILGVTCVVSPEALPVPHELIRIDLPVMVLATVICIPVFRSSNRMTRIEGGLMVVAYAAYLIYLVTLRA